MQSTHTALMCVAYYTLIYDARAEMTALSRVSTINNFLCPPHHAKQQRLCSPEGDGIKCRGTQTLKQGWQTTFHEGSIGQPYFAGMP